jgi:hypothetical protein
VSAPTQTWAGCHGVRLRPDDLGRTFGSSSGTPLLDAELRLGPVEPAAGERLWRIEADAAPPDSPLASQELVRTAGGDFVLSGREPLLAVHPDERTITVGQLDSAGLQLVTTYAMPLLLHGTDALVVHASVCARGNDAVLVAGRSGAGKSTLLSALVDEGWRAVSEDLCAITTDGSGRTLVHPGPPWVRRRRTLPPPASARVLFETPDKIGYDLAPHRCDAPVDLRLVLFLGPPGGDAASVTPLAPAAVLAELAHHALWLGPAGDRAAAVFPPCASISRRIQAAVLQLPERPDWTRLAVPAIDESLDRASRVAAATSDERL